MSLRSTVAHGRAGAGPVSRMRLFVVLAGLYLAQGIPGYLIVAALPPILREQGVSRTTLGFMALLMLPLVIKFLWAPLVDRITPLAIGHRRGWIVITQSLTALVILSLAFVAPTDVVAIFIIGLLISVLTSTQDIATDGYATIMLSAEDRATGNAIQGGAVALSVIVGGTLALLLYGWIGWPATMVVMAVIATLPLAAALLMEEDDGSAARVRERPSLRAFLARPETRDILVVALVYRASEGLMKAMEGPYLVDAGLPLSWIGYLSGVSAATAGIGGSLIAALCLRRIGEGATLGLLGALRTLCFFLFFLHAAGALTGTIPLLGAAGFQTLIRYMEIVALYSLFMGVASGRQPGTDFTILACAQLVVYLVGSMLAGVLADALGYPALFALSTAISAVAVVYTTRRLARRTRAATT
ncbi:MFS transporter, PAT family, beta-lactamase induction signal transducer AmpG [Rhizobium sp. RU20A]|uniref:MFS transporter n=1 Tax=Rhizobium sp. RU20A TaxID=1907412 RepID=UPI0009552F83|nr:MFS transporter [Rhizobium sp. RU20A]SIQ72022.1 MFS transporter, PAT family, beta-lactamase induction signal transducer AmpG [Rhizobium sp. RU20A]